VHPVTTADRPASNAVVQAAMRAPEGVWSPVETLTAPLGVVRSQGPPAVVVAMGADGEAIVAFVHEVGDTGLIESSSRRAGGAWTPPQPGP
jgi:hypothetical protein